nr:MAG TPA: tail assembly chaperone protein [Caudoviricetes sp.]
MKLKFRAIDITEIEEERGIPLISIINDTRIQSLALFVKKGLRKLDGSEYSTEEIYQKIDEYLSKKDTDELLFEITEALQKGGFLPRRMKLKEIFDLKETIVQEVTKTMKEI